MLGPLLNGRADVVYGSRFMGTPGQVRYFRHEMGNKFLTFLSNLFSDIHHSDMETCDKGFRREVVQNLRLESERFGIEVEITAKVARSRQLRIWEVPISYNPRRYGEGKKSAGVMASPHFFTFSTSIFSLPTSRALNAPGRKSSNSDHVLPCRYRHGSTPMPDPPDQRPDNQCRVTVSNSCICSGVPMVIRT